MFETPTSHHIIRKLVIGFGTLFSNLQIVRADSTGTVTQTIKVPLAYAPKEKWETRIDQDPDLLNHVYTTLPRMSFEITGYNYDAQRMVNRNSSIKGYTGGNATSVYASVPYNIDISLYALTKGTEDGLSLVEQILPLFAPEYNLNLIVVPSLNLKQDVPIVLNNVSVQDDYEGDFATRRLVTHTFNFTAKANLYGPIKSGKLITDVTANVDTTTIGAGKTKYHATGVPATGVITDEWTFN